MQDMGPDFSIGALHLQAMPTTPRRVDLEETISHARNNIDPAFVETSPRPWQSHLRSPSLHSTRDNAKQEACARPTELEPNGHRSILDGSRIELGSSARELLFFEDCDDVMCARGLLLFLRTVMT